MTSTQLKKILVKRINKIEDEEFLNAIRIMIEKADREQGIYKLSSLQKKLIKQSDKDFKEGRYFTNEEVFNEIEEWLKEK